MCKYSIFLGAVINKHCDDHNQFNHVSDVTTAHIRGESADSKYTIHTTILSKADY